MSGSSPLNERWYERLDRLVKEYAAKNVIPPSSSSSGSNTNSGKNKHSKHATNLYSDLVKRSDEAFDELKAKKRPALENDPLTRKVLMNGTLTDRIAAMALVISDSPVQSTSELQKLVEMCNSKGRREAALALDAVRDLLIDSLLPSNRRLNILKASLEILIATTTKPMGTPSEILGLLKFEDFLKSQMGAFVRSLERACMDELVHHKITSMKRATDLLLEKPEQERFLLSLLCLKMGDPETKACAQASHLLRKVTNAHPQMRAAIISELESSILSSSASPPFVYEGITFLNQTILHRGESELANRLVDIYFQLFERSIATVEKGTANGEDKKGKDAKNGAKKKNAKSKASTDLVAAKKAMNSRLLAALLTGVNRALPFCETETESSKQKFKERCDQLHKIVKESETFSNSTQALTLLFRLDANRDRFHKALNARLADRALVEGKKTAFLNLLYRALKADQDRSRVAQTVKLLLNVSLRASSSFAAASLFLVSNLIEAKKNLLVDILGEESDDQRTAMDETDASESQSNRRSEPKLGNVENNQVVTKTAAITGDRKEFSVAWELDEFRTHYHPTVQAFAKALLQREPIVYSGDPLHDFAVTSFLDRFVYRNPKDKKAVAAGETASPTVFGLKGREQRVGSKTVAELPVNSEAFHEKMVHRRQRIGEETDRFFFRYFDQLKKSGVSLAQRVDVNKDVDPEELEDAYADELVDKLLRKSAGGDDADVDDDDDIMNEFSPQESDEEGEGDDMDESAMLGSDEGDEDEDEDEDDDDEDWDIDSDDEEGAGGDLSVFADADDFATLIEGQDDGDEEDANYRKGKSSFSKRPNGSQQKRGPPAMAKPNNSKKKQRR